MSNLEFLAQATSIVRDAGEIARDRFGVAEIVRQKETFDLVTDADLSIERQIVAALSRLYPDHGFYAEEQGQTNASAEHVWILDPIDGSKYYARGVPLYSISLALQQRGQLVLGVVYDPQSGQMFEASHGDGARLNGAPINCSTVNSLKDATVCVEMTSRDAPSDELECGMDLFNALVRRARRIRILGVSALGLSYTALGGFDAYVNIGGRSQYYDYAAGQVIALEAGAAIKSSNGKIVAAPSGLVDEIAELIGL